MSENKQIPDFISFWLPNPSPYLNNSVLIFSIDVNLNFAIILCLWIYSRKHRYSDPSRTNETESFQIYGVISYGAPQFRLANLTLRLFKRAIPFQVAIIKTSQVDCSLGSPDGILA